MDFSALKEAAANSKNVQVLDLLPCYKKYIYDDKTVAKNYWHIDPHHNATGYRMMAECIANGIK